MLDASPSLEGLLRIITKDSFFAVLKGLQRGFLGINCLDRPRSQDLRQGRCLHLLDRSRRILSIGAERSEFQYYSTMFISPSNMLIPKTL